jgi:hypothetical protein
MNWPRFPILAIGSLLLLTLPSLAERLSFEVRASASTEARPGAYTDYRFDQPGPFSNLDIFVSWTSSPSDAYIYPAFTFGFEAGQGGYMGTQIVGTRKTAIFSIWDISFDAISAVPNHSNCQRFGHEGTGTSCIMTYNWSTGREYRLRIWAAGSDSTGQNWQATILDVESGQEATIGVIHLKNSKGHEGYGKLTNTPAIFLEYFGGPETCEGQPYAKVTWRGPYADWDTFGATQALVSYPHDVWPDLMPCAANNVTSLACPFVTHEGGGTTQLTTPSGTDVWSGKSCPDPGELPPTPTPTLARTSTRTPTATATPTPPTGPTRTLYWGQG